MSDQGYDRTPPQVRDLHVSFGRGANEVKAVRASLSRSPRARPWPWSRERLGQVGDGAGDHAASAYPLAHHPGGSIRFRGQELVAPAKIPCARSAATTSPWYPGADDVVEPAATTIEKQVNEVLILHKGMSRGRRVRTLELLRLVGIADREKRLALSP